MTVDEIIDGVLHREGGWREAVMRPDGTWDPATNHGITLPTLQRYRREYLGADASETTVETLRNLSTDDARVVYAALNVHEPGFTPDHIPFEPLRVQLIDFGVNSGTARAVRWLQRVCGLQATGTLNQQTINYLHKEDWNGFERPFLAILNDALVAARCRMIVGAVAAGSIRKADELGLLTRAISFTLAKS